MVTQLAQERTGLFSWKGEPMTLVGATIAPGDRAPDFNVRTVDLKPFHLSDALAGGKRAALFVVVPSIDTGICSRETKTFNERVSALPADRIGFFTVSMDLPFAQKRWCGAEGVERMTMLSDFYDHSFGLAYGMWVKERGLLARSIFVVDRTGIVRTAQIMSDLTQEPDYEEVIALASAVI
ncbi:MAG: thiol peroxidase [Candidatus Eremiobacterales bacterium]|jgi:thiol peroxidase